MIEKTQEKLTQLKILQNKHSNKSKDLKDEKIKNEENKIDIKQLQNDIKFNQEKASQLEKMDNKLEEIIMKDLEMWKIMTMTMIIILLKEVMLFLILIIEMKDLIILI